MSVDFSAIRDHKAWLGYIQPEGLVVSPAALVDAQVLLDHNTLPLQARFLPFVAELERDGDDSIAAISDFSRFAREFLEWPEDCLYGLDDSRPLPESFVVSLSELGETLKPSFAFREPKPKDPANPWLLLAQTLPVGTDLDARQSNDESGWNASPSRRFERLLRETGVPVGLLSNGARIRLMYAPRGENSGSATFTVKDMTEVAGRPILAALNLLLNRYRLLAAPSEARLPALLARSREYQSRVSTALAGQVLDALYEMLRGFQGANERAKGELLRSVLAGKPDDIYAGLLTVLMRLVFLLFAEDRGLMPTSELYVRHYSIHGLFERLRQDNEQHPDTMDHRFGAWAQLLTLFRAVYQGCRHPQMHMPARHGHLFDPARFPFLEGRQSEMLDEARLPLVGDGTVYRVLEKLLMLDGERLSYRTLDVEEIGSVYQTVMGFRLEVAVAPSIAIKGKAKKGGVAAPTVINLTALLAAKPAERNKWLKERTDQELSGEAERALKSAATIDDLLAALDRKIARNATPHPIPKDGVALQPNDERRRSGSHYTPRSFTEPIVRTTLKPILERLGAQPTPEQILDLKICDLAVGSAAFLVETCRQLGDALVEAWRRHGDRPPLPADETEELLARRLVAQRCLYGVDRNRMAVDLAKLSLWLATLAKDHPFTFLDHSICHGDSLVGLTRRQIADFHWLAMPNRVFGQDKIEQRIASATKSRKQILDAGDDISPLLKQEKLALADEALIPVREAGDLVIAAFFSAGKDRARNLKRDELLKRFDESYRDLSISFEQELGDLRSGRFPVTPFHWEIEFPEVFDRDNPGFDAIVGNPPFAGKNTLIGGNRAGYLDWLKTLHEESHGNADLVAHFFRRTFGLLRHEGCFGLIATNTIGQGDTRSTGLRWMCTHGGTIYEARRRTKWPGQAAVVVSVVHLVKGSLPEPFRLDGREVPTITAYLFHAGGHENPSILRANDGKSFKGCDIYGLGFTFDDTDSEGKANTLEDMRRLLAEDKRNGELIFPFLGGEELNDRPDHAPHRYVINFGNMTEAEARQWPDLIRIVEEKVRPERLKLRNTADGIRLKQRWWLFSRSRPEMRAALRGHQSALVISQVTSYLGFAFLPSHYVFSHKLCIFPFEHLSQFGVLQSRVHEVWARFHSATLKDDLQYSPVDCFETFPFPNDFESNAALEQAGREYYEFRAALMVRNNEGLTKTYNRFHDPDERQPDIFRLRELHAAMDRAVLEAYGWRDLAEQATCEFILDYEDEEEDNAQAPRRRRKPWRYRWPDEFRDEALARLLALNAERAEEERLAGEAAAAQAPKTSSRKSRKKVSDPKKQIGFGFEES